MTRHRASVKNKQKKRFKHTFTSIPGGLFFTDKRWHGGERAAEVFTDVDLFDGGRTVCWLLSRHLHRFPLTLNSCWRKVKIISLMTAHTSLKSHTI